MEPYPLAAHLSSEARSSPFSPHAFDSTGHGVLVARRPRHGGGGHDTFGERDQSAAQRGPPLRLSTRRLQVFSYVLAELSSATTLLPDYTKAILNLSRRLVGAWQAVTAAAVARTWYEHALVWAAHQWKRTKTSHLRASSLTKKASESYGAFMRVSRRSSRRRAGEKKKRCSSVPVTAAAAASSPSPAVAAALFDSAAASHKRRRLAREATPAAASSDVALTDQRLGRSQQPSNTPSDGSAPALPCVDSPTSSSKHLQADVAATPPLPSPSDRCRGGLHSRVAHKRRRQLVQRTLQQLWLDAQEAEDKAGQHVEYIRGLVVNALYQQYLQVTVEASYHDVVLYRWLSPWLFAVRRGSAGPRQTWLRQGYRQRCRSASAPQGGGSLQHALQHQAAVQVVADVQLLRYVLGRARIAAGPSRGAGRRSSSSGDSGIVVASLAMGHGSASSVPLPPTTAAARGAVGAGGPASFATVDGGGAAATASSEGTNSDGVAARRTASTDGSRSSSGLSTHDPLDDCTLAVPMPLKSFLQACVLFDPTHCAFALMSRCVLLAQHVRSGDDEQAVPLHVAPDGKGAWQEVRGGVGRADEGATEGVDGEAPAREYFGLFYVVIARRAIGGCACTAMCFGNHKFIFVRCHDTEALLREAMPGAESDGGACEGSEASAEATEEEEERHPAHVSRLSADADATTCTSNEAVGEAERLAGTDAQTPPSASTSSTAGMVATAEGHRRHLPLSRFCSHSRRMDKLTLPSPARGISALSAHDAHRLKRDATEKSGTGERGRVAEAGPSRRPPSEAATHSLPSSPRSTPPSGSVQCTLSGQPHSPMRLRLSTAAGGMKATASTAWSGAALGAAALQSSTAEERLRTRALTRQAPSPHGKRLFTQTLSATQDASFTDCAIAAAPGRAYTASTIASLAPALRQPIRADARSSAALVSDASLQSLAARAESMPACSPLSPLLQGTASVFPGDDALADEEDVEAEFSCASALKPLHTESSRHAVGGGLATRCTASATHPMPGSALLPCRASSSTSLTSSSFVAAFSDSDDDAQDADAADRARCLQQRHGFTAAYPDRIADGDDERSTEEEDATAEDGEGVFGSSSTQAFVVMHSVLCSCGAQDLTSEFGEATEPAAAASPWFTTAATPSFFERSHARRRQLDTPLEWPSAPLGDSVQGLSGRSSVPCAADADFPFSYFEQRVLLPPGSGHERRVGGGCSGGGDGEAAHPRAPLIEMEQKNLSPTLPSAWAAEPTDAPLGVACPRARAAGAEAAAAQHKAAATVGDAGALPVEVVVSSPPDPEESKLYDFAKEYSGPEPKGTSSCHRQHALCAAGTSAVEPSEGDMAFAAELYARLQFWSLRGQDRSAYIDPSWTRQSSHKRPEGEKWSAPSASHSCAGNTETLEELVEADRQHPAAPFASYATGVDAPRRVQTGMSRAAPGTRTSDKPVPGEASQSSPDSSMNASDGVSSKNAIELPLRLLHCTVGTIALSDEALQAPPRAGTKVRKRRRAAHADERQTKRRSRVAGSSGATEEEADDPLAKDAEECDEGGESFPRLPSLMTVNARGKALLFEALREATEVVVCGVRESRAHTGYHDVLHQRCPPPPSSTSASAAPQNGAGVRSEGDAGQVGHDPRADAAVTPTTGTPSKSTWITTVNPWMAAAAAAQGCSFRVAAGTLSRDGRNPFAFDTHRHLGVCGIVCWSQGDISREEEAGSSPADVSDDEAVMTMAVPTEDSAPHGAEGISGATHHQDHVRRSDSSHMPKWRWPKLPANDHKQWRCELLKSEFRLARSRCLDCLLVDHTHGRPIAAITLAPWSWPRACFGLPSDAVYSGDDDGDDEGVPSRRCTERHRAGAEAADAPSPQEVVQRSVYIVVGFTHYIAPLWRHLREEKAVLVDMDRTLIDNAITERSAVERQRHLRHLRRVVAAAEGVAGAENPCVLWRRYPATPSSERFAGAPLRLGRNDAPPLTAEELAESMVRGADGQQEGVLHLDSRGHHLHSNGTFHFSHRRTEAVEDDCVLRPAIRQRPPHTPEPLLSHAQATTGDTSALSSGCLLQCFMRRTASQRRSLGIVHYEECGAVRYTAASPSALGPASAVDSPSKSGYGHGYSSFASRDTRETSSASSADADALRSSTAKSATTSATAAATPPARYLLDVVYVRPGVRQFLYRVATQWNIPVVLVTKSTRSRTEAILRQVLDPHRVLFPDMRSSVVTADEMLRWCDDAERRHDDVGTDEEASAASDVGFAGPVGGMPAGHSRSATSSVPNSAHARLVPLQKPAPKSTAERIARCRKGARRVVQFILDAAAMTAARRAWRAPAWCDWPNRLPKPRSIAVLDDAPQVWEESDWPCTVNVAPYTLARVDPRAYFSRRGYVTSLVLSCLYGSKCLVCSEGVLRLPEWQGADALTSPSSPHTPSATLSVPESRGLGAYRWPHCVCVCPPDHLRDLARAEEDVPVGYTNTSFSAAASDLSASVSAMLTALLWRMSNNAALCSSQQPLLLPAIEDSVATELTEQARGAESQVGASRRGGGRRRRRRRHACDLGATMCPASEDRCEKALPATATVVDVLRRAGRAMRPGHVDTEGIASPWSPSSAVFATATCHSFSSASASAQSASSPSSSSSASRSNPSLSSTTASSFSLEPFAWGAGFGHAAVNARTDTCSYAPSTMMTAASMPPTPMTFHAFPDLPLESRVLGGVPETDDDEQHGLRFSMGSLSANTTASSRNTVRGESAALQTPPWDGYTDATSNGYEAHCLRSSAVDDVIPLEMQAAPSVLEPLCTPGSPSYCTEDVGGALAMASVDSVPWSSGGSHKALRSSSSFTPAPRKGVVPITSVPGTLTERVVVDVDEPAPPWVCEAELQRPRHRLLDDLLDEVEDVTPL
ncbi:conserved hypothetical protein [Leishmania major strain Friedlin]|uniref:Uncharacterized protein n=1 Tax=Leishmania major TaxID=5664 RepID=Q4QB73_LEIMA|nr:conserved hypothetical protein [Leishmania major strain Friedlin]CAG9574282.1 hypothetical_protein_-_conserved [Leishmania major strain Friedlin]CAJ04522.1 conserved hypothetical protein [Leishmania major strain Friedlin]|eukprot:XP_001683425.1 conserved hypothetical protein [Leishmania major strain Friedlin]